jgi:hypothetical protein
MARLLPLFILPLALAASAQPSSCSSDGVPAPRALLERFINADCEQCWKDPQAPEPGSGTLAIDWVAPGGQGEDAPLSAVATQDGADRLGAIGKPVPAQSTTRFAQRAPESPVKLRVAHGLPFNEYIGTSIEMRPVRGGPWRAWLLLVETLPAGSEGSPVERNLVRNAFVADWPAANKPPVPKRYELRPMRLAEGTKVERLRVVGWVEDAKGRIRAIAQSRCGR